MCGRLFVIQRFIGGWNNSVHGNCCAQYRPLPGGRDYQTIIPLSMLMGAWLLLVIDTIGRIVVLPSELSAAVIMTVIGGPFLIMMLQRKNFNGIKSS